MKQKFKNVVYDTDAAEEIGSRYLGSNRKTDDDRSTDTLFVMPTGEYFLYCQGGPDSVWASFLKTDGGVELIVPLTPRQAVKWSDGIAYGIGLYCDYHHLY